MATSTLILATIGGTVSFLSTSLGTVLSVLPWRAPGFSKFKFSIDFALGLMLSAVAFSLVGPAVTASRAQAGLLGMSLLGFGAGGLLIYAIKAVIERRRGDAPPAVSSSQLVLALALMIHNFPEGLASGAALAGLSRDAALPILTSISIQNVPEGLLMVVCLRAMGWGAGASFLGGIASGLVELAGGIVSGFALTWAASSLPVILMIAGGAMFTSVVIEIREQGDVFGKISRPEFVLGLLAIPALNMLAG